MATHDPNRVLIFDTTLRDGEQSPGCTMTLVEKLRLARALAELGVDIIEAGFPVASRGDWESVQAIAREIEGPVIAGLARCNAEDIERAWSAIQDAGRPRLHLFLATSAIHRQYKLNMAREEIVHAAVEGVKFARTLCEDVEFSPEDASRTELEFLAEVVEGAVAAGATTINIPDTVGYTVPEEYYETFQYLKKNVRGIGNVVLSAHCHDDLGMAVANSLAAIRAGARQVECTINGLGERAGNAALEEVVMALRTRNDAMPFTTGINTEVITRASRLVSTITGFAVQPNKAIVGANAFAHESGIHQDGVLKHRETYEIMRAEDVGWHANRLTLGKLSGRAAFKSKLAELGIVLETEEALNTAFARFKDLADKKREIFDEDLQALVSDEGYAADHERYKLVSLKVCSETGEVPHAQLVFTDEGAEKQASGLGSGPVDATFKALESVVNSGADLLLYSVNNITSGTDSQGEVTVRLALDGRVVNGQGADTDIVVASAKAYLHGLNKLHSKRERAHPQV
jgi:2-isopropylmalate synthase